MFRRRRKRTARQGEGDSLAAAAPADDDVEVDPAQLEAEARRRSGLATPEDYLADICGLHQLVLLGDQRYVADHLEFLAAMVPVLWQRGVRNLAWEFTNSRRQAELDALVSAGQWSAEAAHDLFVDLLGVGLGYRQYIDILHATWAHNAGLPDSVPPMRVVALGLPSFVEDPDLLDGRSGGETELRNWWLGGHYRDVTAIHMANTLTNEVVRRQERALVYADADRTTTKLLQLDADEPSISAGNLLYRWMGEGVQRVLFHGAVPDEAAITRVETLVDASPDGITTFGIDLELSTLGSVPVASVAGLVGGTVRRLELADLADGYLYLGPVQDWRPVELEACFLRAANLDAAERQYRALDPRPEPYTLEELEEVRREGAEEVPLTWPRVFDQEGTEPDGEADQ
jgi:hypothetical protein